MGTNLRAVGLIVLILLCSSEYAHADICVTTLMRLQRTEHRFRTQISNPVPIGMSEADFKVLLLMIEKHPSFSTAKAVVLYGSRTHMSAGYPPTINSDLDVAIFHNPSKGTEISDFAFTRFGYANAALKALSRKCGFAIEEQIPKLETFEEFLAREQNGESRIGELSRIQLLDEIAKSGNWDREMYREVTWNIQKDRFFGPEAIFILKASPNVNILAAKLRSLGYQNIYVLNGRSR